MAEKQTFQEVVQAFWATHSVYDLWSIETTRVDAQTIRATIKRADRLVVTAHYSSNGRVETNEEQAIIRAIGFLPNA